MSEAKKSEGECIQVVVRCRPFNNKEKNEGRGNIITVDSETRQISIANPNEPDDQPKSFTFDATYDETTQQKVFYEESCFGLVESVLEGFNGTIFAYGQTGCGKSWTMQGPINAPDNLKGVIPNSFGHIFQHIKASSDIEFLVRCSYLEIYNEEIKDLLVDPKFKVPCEIKEDPSKGIFIKGLSDVIVESEADLQAMLDKGAQFRSVAATLMNETSSRSHSIFTVVIEMSSKDETGKDHIRAGKLNLVDLAGSERQKKTGASGAQLKEGIKINLSLSSLGNVISALAENKGKHIPYRESKLTRLLQDSLGGNTKTLMVAAVSPADYNYDETMSTLRYANRAKNIQNKPKVNEDPKDTLLREYKEEIERLRKLLQEQMAGGRLSDAMASMDAMSSMLASTPAAHSSSHSHVEDGGGSSSSKHHHQQQHASVAEDEEEEVQEAVHHQPHTPVKPKSHKSPTHSKAPVSQEEDAYLESSGNYTDDFDPEMSTKKLRSPQREAGEGDGGVQREIQYVERIPDSYLSEHRALKEHAEQVAYERDQAHEQLEMTAEEVEKERKLREDLKDRLQQLQSKLVGHGDDLDGPEVNNSSQSQKVRADQQKEREEAEKAFEERKQRAKKKRDARQQQLQKVLNEKQAVEEELEELRRSAASWASVAHQQAAVKDEAEEAMDVAAFEKKLNKLRKKYDKRVQAMKQDNDEIKEEFYYQRQQLQDALTEQEKDLKLFEQICKALLTDKDLKKIVDKAKWSEDDDEWILPYVKKRSLDENNNNGGKLLPDIFAGQPKGSGVGASANAGSDYPPPSGSLSARAPSPKVTASRGKSGPVLSGSRPSSSAASGLVPMLMLPANGPVVPPVDSGVGIAGGVVKKKKKKRKPKPIADKSLLPEMQTDEAGCGESAGAITDWGFAGAGEDVPDGEPEPEYSDDEDFEGESPRAPVSTLAPPLNKGGLPPTGLAVDKGGSKSKASGGGGSGFSLPTVKVSPRGT